MAISACSTAGDDPGAGPPHLAQVQSDSTITAAQAKLIASDGAAGHFLGASVAMSGNTAILGAGLDDELGARAGAAYVFVRSGTHWVQQAKLTAGDGASNDQFGTAVAISGDTAVVTALFADGMASDSGAAYVFVRTGSTWTQQAKLIAADGSTADQLGRSVALSGDTALVSTIEDGDNGSRSGSAYVFVRSGTAWTQQAKILPADGQTSDQFGISVALAGDTALIGAWGDDDQGDSSGSAYVFVRSGAAWSPQAKLLASTPGGQAQFGVSVALQSDTALIGANLDDDVDTDAGAAYVFTRSGAAWTQQAKLTAADGTGGDKFGTAVALDGNTALIGMPNDSDLGAESGSAYLFTHSATGWAAGSKLMAADGAAVDMFGSAVALAGDVALIGTPGASAQGDFAGAAYVYAAPAAPGDPGSNGETCASNADCASGFCTDGVCCNTACDAGGSNRCDACSVAAGGAVDGTCGPRAAGTICRAAAGGCDTAERCNGSALSCPSDAMASAGTVCRTSAGACDVAETCTGNSAACPTDHFASASTVCRPAGGSCDITETCMGTSALCPPNQLKPNLSLCSGGVLGLPGLCLGGICIL